MCLHLCNNSVLFIADLSCSLGASVLVNKDIVSSACERVCIPSIPVSTHCILLLSKLAATTVEWVSRDHLPHNNMQRVQPVPV
jgi:hypothetical protein